MHWKRSRRRTRHGRRLVGAEILIAAFAIAVAQGVLLPTNAFPEENGRLSGRVVDAADHVVPNAEVTLYSYDHEVQGWTPKSSGNKAGGDGTFAFGGLKEGTYVVVVKQPGLASAIRSAVIEKDQTVAVDVESIRLHVEKEGLKFPIVVDQPDGRTIAAYKAHGIGGFPSYVLIGPDGTVIYDGVSVPAPSLRLYKIELVRQLLMGRDRGKVGRADSAIGHRAIGPASMPG